MEENKKQCEHLPTTGLGIQFCAKCKVVLGSAKPEEGKECCEKCGKALDMKNPHIFGYCSGCGFYPHNCRCTPTPADEIVGEKCGCGCHRSEEVSHPNKCQCDPTKSAQWEEELYAIVDFIMPLQLKSNLKEFVEKTIFTENMKAVEEERRIQFKFRENDARDIIHFITTKIENIELAPSKQDSERLESISTTGLWGGFGFGQTWMQEKVKEILRKMR